MTTATATALLREFHNGELYIVTERRGVRYVLHRLAGAWFVSTRRLSLGRWNTGGGHYFATLEDVAVGCKAFAHLEQLQAAVFGFDPAAV